MEKYKDAESYNKWLHQCKEYKVWLAEEVVRILKAFGAKSGEDLRAHKDSNPQHSMTLKRRRC